jgi:S-DNA-T family DNA segregation ATPase FtsK/SpoIIIE
VRFSITARDGRERGRDVDVLLDADPDDPLIEVLGPVVVALGDPMHPSFLAHLPVWVDGVPVEAADSTLREARLRPGSVLSVHAPASPPPDRPAGVAEIRVVNGPGAGRVHRLPLGETLVGCGAAGLSLPDVRVPANGLRVNGTIQGTVLVAPAPGFDATLDGEPLEGEAEWPEGAYLVAGETVLQRAPLSAPDGDVSVATDHAGVDFNRPPRLLPPDRETRFTIPQEPRRPIRRQFPWIMVISPALMAAPMALFFHSYYFLMFAAMSPFMALANYVMDKKTGRREYRESYAEWETTKEDAERRTAAAMLAERDARRLMEPDPAALLLATLGPSRRLWERRRADPDSLRLRLGLAERPTTVMLMDRNNPDVQQKEGPTYRPLADVPAGAELRRLGVLGVAGDPEVARPLARWLIAQVAALHSPRDVKLVLLTRSDAGPEWDWVRWLPHARDDSDVFGAMIGNDQDSMGRRIAELGQLVATRRGERGSGVAAAGGRGLPPGPDVVVVLDGARRLRSLPGVVSLLRDGPEVGVYLICLDDDAQALPEECSGVVQCGAHRVVLHQAMADDVADIRPDVVELPWVQRVARALSPVRDISPSEEDTGLPKAARLLECLELDPPSADGVLGWWGKGPSTEVVLGAGYDGLFRLDLRRDGPHALIAGTTGSGKSELLQTLVAALAVANRADELTFVLVDYKGGSAFKECAKLPHTVGMVTDLDTHLVSRALTSLGAELRRREHLLAVPGAKDIEDYTALRRRDASLPAMPRLVLVIDEFASMVAELPDFVTGLVSIAQRGRSLGIHLVLATQRPSGVVSPEIRANTNLRIALRVTDETESKDVIDAPDSARIGKGTPGRGYARTGHSTLMPFQAGRVGGARPGRSGAVTRPSPLAWPVPWQTVGLPTPVRPKVGGGPATDEGDTDLSDLVASILQADAAAEVPQQPSPWLPALPGVVAAGELPPAESSGVSAAPDAVTGTLSAPWALEDHPAEQEQVARLFRLGVDGHLYVIGGPRSGRSTVLRTIAASLADRVSARDLHVYALDCGNGALLPLEALPHTGVVVSRTQVERADRLLRRLSEEVDRRQELLAEGGFADVAEQRAAVAPDERLPYQVFVLDRWEGFSTTLGEIDAGRLADEVLRLLREGASVGLHVLMSGDRSLLSGRVSTLVESKLILRLPDRNDFALANLAKRQVPESMPDGRGVWGDSAIEAHVVVLGEPGEGGAVDVSGAGQAAAVREIAARASQRDAGIPAALQPMRLGALPTEFPAPDALALLDAAGHPPSWVPLGIGGDDLRLLGLDLAVSPIAVVSGPPRSGRTNVLRFAAAAARRRGVPLLALTPRPNALGDDVPAETLVSGTAGPVDELVTRLRSLPPGALVLVDDAEMLRDGDLAPALAALVRQAREKSWGVVVAGETAQLTAGLSGWLYEARRGRQGLLLSPQTLVDGEVVGTRLARSALTSRVIPGRGLLVEASVEGLPIQSPLV